MIEVLNDFGFSSFGLTEVDFIKPGNVIQMGYPPFRIDILTKIDGVEFMDCYANRMIIQHDQISMNFIGINELKENKRASGRPKDLDDLVNLSSKI